MKREKFLKDAKLEPARFYRNPSDVMRDRRLTHDDRLEILTAWERSAEHGQEFIRQELHRVREQLESGESEFAGRRYVAHSHRA